MKPLADNVHVPNRRTTACAAIVALIMLAPAVSSGQAMSRRAAPLSALLAYPGFYHGQLVVVRGTLATRDQPVLLSSAIDRSISLLFKGPSPADGPVELRATFWDIGRLTREDPRVVSQGLERLVPGGTEGDWPKPGAIFALSVTDAMAISRADKAPTLREIVLDPSSFTGQRVAITGQFRGRNLYGDLPQGPGLSQWDFVLRGADAAIWVTGLRPRGKGFNLDTSARVDTGSWLEATGVVKVGKGLVWIEAQQFALAKPEVELKTTEAPPPPQIGPPPEVIFTDPGEGEVDVSLKGMVRIQFSRDMNPESFKGHIRWNFTAPGANAGPAAADSEMRAPAFKYDRARRALEVTLGPQESALYREAVVELVEGITATDGAPLKPWMLKFSFGAK